MTANSHRLPPLITMGFTWEQVATWCRENQELPSAEIEDGVAALAHLRILFGEDFSRLPPLLFERLLNQAGWVYRWVAWLSASLKPGTERRLRRVAAASRSSGQFRRGALRA